VAALVILGFAAAAIAEFVVDLVIDYTVTLHSAAQADVISIVLSLMVGAVVGGAMLLARPRHYGVTAVTGVSAIVAGVIADELAMFVYLTLRDLPLPGSLFLDYFADARPVFWIGQIFLIALASGLPALRVMRVRAHEGQGAGAPGMPPPPWAPPQMPPGPPGQPWGPPQPPYGTPPGSYGPPRRPGG
jgi:hypothetical protein